MRTPFDPLYYLISEFHLAIDLDSKGNIVSRACGLLEPYQKEKAQTVLNAYDKLLHLQLKRPPCLNETVSGSCCPKGRLKSERGSITDFVDILL